MARDNVEVVRRFYEAFNGGGFDGPDAPALVRELFHPDIEIEQMEDIAGTTGRFRGYHGLLASKRELEEVISAIRFEVEEERAAGDRVACVVCARGTGRTSGVPVDLRVGHLWLLADGRAVRWVVYRNADEALQAVSGAG